MTLLQLLTDDSQRWPDYCSLGKHHWRGICGLPPGTLRGGRSWDLAGSQGAMAATGPNAGEQHSLLKLELLRSHLQDGQHSGPFWQAHPLTRALTKQSCDAAGSASRFWLQGYPAASALGASVAKPCKTARQEAPAFPESRGRRGSLYSWKRRVLTVFCDFRHGIQSLLKCQITLEEGLLFLWFFQERS